MYYTLSSVLAAPIVVLVCTLHTRHFLVGQLVPAVHFSEQCICMQACHYEPHSMHHLPVP